MNLDIEGTKHEKVVIIVLSYVIGFTAGFICFGVAAAIHHERATDVAVVAPIALPTNDGFAEAVKQAPTALPATTTANGTAVTDQIRGLAVTYEDGKLQAKVGENMYLLSMRSSGLDSAVQSAFKNQGIHTDIPAYITSPDNKYVYFCEQQAAADSCNSFIFDVEKNVIEYVTVDGKKLSTTGAVAKSATWTEKGLSIDGKVSAEVTAPAVLLTS